MSGLTHAQLAHVHAWPGAICLPPYRFPAVLPPCGCTTLERPFFLSSLLLYILLRGTEQLTFSSFLFLLSSRGRRESLDEPLFRAAHKIHFKPLTLGCAPPSSRLQSVTTCPSIRPSHCQWRHTAKQPCQGLKWVQSRFSRGRCQ